MHMSPDRAALCPCPWPCPPLPPPSLLAQPSPAFPPFLPQASGKLPDMLLEVSKAEQSVSFIINRTRQIKAVGCALAREGKGA